tara:strand:+ start:75 stop:695 length:621 start_codon:yes stop_codon:yes gene_type:complete
MIKQIITFYFLLNLLLGLPQDSNDDDWDVVQKKKFWIGYLESDFPWCRGETVVDATMDEVLSVIRDVNNYHTFFKSVFISEINKDNEVHIVFDLPLWLWDRDYTVKFVESKYDNVVKYTFNSIKTDFYPEREKTIRLPNFGGSWYLEEKSTNEILVKYTFNCEMLGKFPEWAFSKACGIGCNEVLKGLTGEVERRRWDGTNKDIPK